MATVTKADLIQYLFEVVGINKREAKEIIELFFDEISAALVAGEPIKLPELGVFKPKQKDAREGRNPKTGAKVKIDPQRTVVFKATDSLKRKIQAYEQHATQTESTG